MLDIEVVAGLCPKATIAVYFSRWSEKGWVDNLDAVLTDDRRSADLVGELRAGRGARHLDPADDRPRQRHAQGAGERRDDGVRLDGRRRV